MKSAPVSVSASVASSRPVASSPSASSYDSANKLSENEALVAYKQKVQTQRAQAQAKAMSGNWMFVCLFNGDTACLL